MLHMVFAMPRCQSGGGGARRRAAGVLPRLYAGILRRVFRGCRREQVGDLLPDGAGEVRSGLSVERLPRDRSNTRPESASVQFLAVHDLFLCPPASLLSSKGRYLSSQRQGLPPFPPVQPLCLSVLCGLSVVNSIGQRREQ